MRTVAVMLNLPEDQALALAQFVKRLTWGDMRQCAVDDAEASDIRAAVEEVSAALAEEGFAPR